MKLSAYVAKTVFLATLSILLLILSIDFVFAMIGEVNGLEPGASLLSGLIYVLLRMPSDLSLIFPIAGFLGALVGLSLMASKSELIAMRAAGFSIFSLAKAVLLTASFLLSFYYLLTVFLAPYSRHLSINEDRILSRQGNILVLSSETWLKSGGHFLLMGVILPEGVVQHVTDFWVQNGTLTHIRKIDEIHLNPNGTWVLSNVVDTKIEAKRISQTRQATLSEPSLISSALLPIISMSPDEMTLPVLYSYIHFRTQNNLDSKQYELEFWSALIGPLMLPIMMLLSIPFVLGSLRSGAQTRIIIGLVMGFGFYIVSQFFGSLTLLSPLPPILGASVPILFFGSLAGVLFFIVSRR